MKRLIRVLFAAAMFAALCACAKKESNQQVPFTELKLGAEKAAVAAQMGSEGVSSGSTPEHLTYESFQMFDFVDPGEKTKLTVFLNTEDKAYAYAYYMYDALEQNYADIKKYLENRFGPAVQGENASEQWKDGDKTYSLNKQSDYIAIGLF